MSQYFPPYRSSGRNIRMELDLSSYTTKTNLTSSKITEIESKIPSITHLATSSALTSVENKIPDVNDLVKKTDHNTKIKQIEKKITDHNHGKYITAPEFNNLSAGVFLLQD